MKRPLNTPAGRVRAYFPEVYREEILYSIVARYGRHLGLYEAGLREHLYPGPDGRYAVDFPKRINLFSEIVGSSEFNNPDEIIDRYTLFNFHSAFASDDARATLKNAQKSNGPVDSTMASGITIPNPTHLRFCPTCREEMLRDHFELYWKRVHQIPCVMICPYHGDTLLASDVSWSANLPTAATVANCPENAPPVAMISSSEQHEFLLRIALIACEIMLDASNSRTDQLEHHRRRIRLSGTMASAKRIGKSALIEALTQPLNHVVHIWPKLARKGVQPGYWLMAGVRDGATLIEASVHALIRALLDTLPLPWGEGPWRCLWGECPTSFDTDIVTSRPAGAQLVATFRCASGHEFDRSSADQSGALLRSDANGCFTRDALLRANEEKWTRHKTCEHLGTDVYNLVRISERLDVVMHWHRRGSAALPSSLMTNFGSPEDLTGVDSYCVTNSEWAIIDAALASMGKQRRATTRRAIEAFFWKLRSKTPWPHLPERFGHHPSRAAHLVMWRNDGTWERLVAEIEARITPRATSQGDI